ncbi:MAG: NAD(P)H-binding protein [Planctomycetes bacterium]|nr:NAD(P)H-binding protein [Planctomycetota bacterium]
MRVLVSGSTGLVGSHVLAALLARGHEPRALARPGRPSPSVASESAEGDLDDEASLRRALRGCEGLVHAAGFTTGEARLFERQRAVHVEGTSRLLRAAQAAGVARVAHVSCMFAVGFTRQPVPLAEGTRWNGVELRLEAALIQKEAEQRALAAAWAGLELAVAIPGWVLGRAPGAPDHPLVAALRAGSTRASPAGGASVIDAADAALGIVRVLESGRRGERYLLGGENAAWADVDARLARALGRPAPPARGGLLARWRAAPPHDLLRPAGVWSWIDDAKARSELGHAARPLDEAVRRAATAGEPAPRS